MCTMLGRHWKPTQAWIAVHAIFFCSVAHQGALSAFSSVASAFVDECSSYPLDNLADAGAQDAREAQDVDAALATWWHCVFSVVYGKELTGFEDDPRLGKAGTYGEISALGVRGLLRHLSQTLLPGGLTAQDGFLDLGAGVGKVVLQVGLMWEPKFVAGVELSQHRCDISKRALQRLRDKVGPDVKGVVQGIEFRCEDVLKTSLDGATVVFMNSICFPSNVMHELINRLTELTPGTIIISSARLPGCHRGLIYASAINLVGTKSTPAFYQVYVVAPHTRSFALDLAYLWRVDTSSAVVIKAVHSEAQSFLNALADPLNKETTSTVFEKMAVEYLNTTVSLASRIFALLTQKDPSISEDVTAQDHSISPHVLERFLMSWAEGDAGSMLQCYVTEFCDILQSTLDSVDAKALLGKLLEAFPSIDHLRADGGDSALHLVAAAGDHHAVDSLCDVGADTDRLGANLETAVFRAAKALLGGAETMDALVKHRADVNVKNSRGSAALHVAAYYGRLPAAEVLLAAGAELESTNRDGETVVHRAARGGEVGVLRLLAAGRADLCAKDGRGFTALDAAQERRQKDAALELQALSAHCNEEL